MLITNGLEFPMRGKLPFLHLETGVSANGNRRFR